MKLESKQWMRAKTGLGLVVVSLILSSCTEKNEEMEPVARPVKLHDVKWDVLESVHEYPGQVEAIRESSLAFEVAGRIESLPAKEGNLVEAGAVIAKLDDRNYRADFQAAVARLEAADSELKRRQKLYDQNAGSSASLEAARNSYENALAGRDIAQKRLDDTVLRAPFKGQVARVVVNDFANIVPGQVIVLLQDNSKMQAEVDIPETAWAIVNAAATLESASARARPELYLTSYPEKVIPVRFTEFATAADPVSRTFAVKVAFERPEDLNINSGMTAKVCIRIPSQRSNGKVGALVPMHCVFYGSGGKARVWKFISEDTSVRSAIVELGDVINDQVQVLSGLESGDQIAVSGIPHLREGMVVSPWQ